MTPDEFITFTGVTTGGAGCLPDDLVPTDEENQALSKWWDSFRLKEVADEVH